LPEEVVKAIHFVFADTVDDVLKAALTSVDKEKKKRQRKPLQN
jgi:hypothetical protein